MPEKETVRLAQIGLGAWSSVLANAVRKSTRVDLVTCFDTIPEKRKRFVQKYGCDPSESYEAVLERDDIDGVERYPAH